MIVLGDELGHLGGIVHAGPMPLPGKRGGPEHCRETSRAHQFPSRIASPKARRAGRRAFPCSRERIEDQWRERDRKKQLRKRQQNERIGVDANVGHRVFVWRNRLRTSAPELLQREYPGGRSDLAWADGCCIPPLVGGSFTHMSNAVRFRRAANSTRSRDSRSFRSGGHSEGIMAVPLALFCLILHQKFLQKWFETSLTRGQNRHQATNVRSKIF